MRRDSTYEREKQFTQSFVRKPEGKRKLAGSRPICDDNIKMDLKEINGRMWAIYWWLRIESSDCIFVFHKMLKISLVTEELFSFS
jgi:hypothetical protein